MSYYPNEIKYVRNIDATIDGDESLILLFFRAYDDSFTSPYHLRSAVAEIVVTIIDGKISSVTKHYDERYFQTRPSYAAVLRSTIQTSLCAHAQLELTARRLPIPSELE